MRFANLKKLMLLATGVFLFQAGGCALTDTLSSLLGSLFPGT